ncbi:MaoC/PaaZ C-terminal domain-containing protein [Plantactinospora sp. KBS50]|uniref:MaoC/PaaZ C-terminal domain-containing protein n=1 Tax=Plantactinospora sp. KBS50 TaxID=2024580 RepID=UPI0012FD617E|nr:MaoC/PaaZ C-terminal domain-containing protein [Plantactinospora sp. KBS50]
MRPSEIAAGAVLTHPYSRTVTDADNMLATLGSLNTAQVHFNVEAARRLLDGAFTERIVVGGCVLAIVTGLATAGWGSAELTEAGIEDLRFRTPVYAGDTLTASSEVLDVSPGAGGTVLVRTRLTGTNQRGDVVASLHRTFRVRP